MCIRDRDNARLIAALQNLRDIGNSVLVVEHDKDIMLAADYLVDIGPKAGTHGGSIVAAGTPAEVLRSGSETAQYLSGKKKIPVPETYRKGTGKKIELKGVTGNNLKNVSVSFPLGKFILVTGVSGSGKSTLVNDTLYPLLSNYCYRSRAQPMPYKTIKGLEEIDKVIEIDQSPIGRTPPVSYTHLDVYKRQHLRRQSADHLECCEEVLLRVSSVFFVLHCSLFKKKDQTPNKKIPKIFTGERFFKIKKLTW